MTALFSVAGVVISLLSLNYLFASNENDGGIVIQGFETSTTEDLRDILKENSVLDDYLLQVEGVASHYGKKFHKRKTASGERYNMHEYSAAHRNLPFGTILKVTNLNNDKSVLVRVNDRGPFIRKRILDLSQESARELDGMGLPKVKIEGFVRGQIDIPAKFDEDYYFAYSLNHQPMIIPNDYLSIRHTFRDFNSAMTHYKELVESGLYDKDATFIIFDKETFDSFNDETEFYHIASWRPVLRRKIPVMMAEKVYPESK